MAHLVESMFSVKETPWHKLGVIVQDAPTIGDAINLAGLNWRVKTIPLFTADGRAVKACAVVRESDNSILGDHVGANWTPLQNSEAFDWFQPFVDAGEVKLETAGSLDCGRRVWLLAELNRAPAEIIPGDTVRKFLLLSNSHDGSLAVRVGFTPIRVVCNNTLTAAHDNEQSRFIRVLHTQGVKRTVDNLRGIIDAADKAFETSADAFRTLARRPIRGGQLAAYAKDVFSLMPNADNPLQLCTRSQGVLDAIMRNYEANNAIAGELLAADRARAQAETQAQEHVGASLLESILSNFESGRGTAETPAAKGTWWQAYNAVTEYLTHERGRNAESRLNSAWFGSSAALNRKALDTALSMSA